MKQLELDYQAYNYTDTSKSAWANKKDKLTKREQVYELLKLNALSNYQIADELEMPLSSVCARVRELQLTGHIEDSGLRRKTQFGKLAIVWRKKDQQ
jgi:predicted Rossmann fold nucleotide-binding protein DprA/Smf involved in DNA uptake